jgi:mono/diheme cytochrome c family protein
LRRNGARGENFQLAPYVFPARRLAARANVEERMRRGLAMAVMILAAPAADAADVAAGAKLARAHCAECHSIADDPGARSVNALAPRFADVANAPSTTETALKVFLQSPHRNMPDFILSAAERDAVVAYILSLRR